MKSTIQSYVLAAILATIAYGTASEALASDGWTNLFDGKSLNG